jgi:hypothetical protein
VCTHHVQGLECRTCSCRHLQYSCTKTMLLALYMDGLQHHHAHHPHLIMYAAVPAPWS